MTQIEVAEMVGDMYWSRLPDGSEPVGDEAAVQMVMQHAGVERGKAMGLLMEHSPASREQRAQQTARTQRRDERGRWI